MNWEERLNKWADSTESKADQVLDWGSAEVPQYVQELIRWEIVSGLSYAILFLSGAIFVTFLVVKAWRWTANPKNIPEEERYFAHFLLLIGTVFTYTPLILFGSNEAMRATKAYVSPRVVIVEKISELVKNNRR